MRNCHITLVYRDASSVQGENQSKASIADYEAQLESRRAEAKRLGEVAMAEASRDVLRAEKEEEIARLEKLEIAQQLDISERTVRREWLKARAWLYKELYSDTQ